MIYHLYNALVALAWRLARLAARCGMLRRDGKAWRFVEGHRGLGRRIADAMAADHAAAPVAWVHVASYGEYAIARPLMARLRDERGLRIVLTVFSPTAYEALRDSHQGIDHLFYLPIDTASRARRFLDAVRPACAVFLISEYWLSHLRELRRRDIPTYLVSANIRRSSVFFAWYGGLYRKALRRFTHVYTVSPTSAECLRDLGVRCATLTQNTLFDNAALVAATPWSDDIIARFCQGRRVFIAGSVSDENDLALVAQLADDNPDTPFIIVPHEITPRNLADIDTALPDRTILYTRLGPDDDPRAKQCLVVDTMGMLASLYRYGTWAYVGGGFTPLLHSLAEPAAYGLPVAFGPDTRRLNAPALMQQAGIAHKVRTYGDLAEWFAQLKDNDDELADIRTRAKAFVEEHAGAAKEIAGELRIKS